MLAKIVQIGNSKGVRIPRAVLSQCGFTEEIELEVQENGLLLKPVKQRRQGWAEAFKQMAAQQNNGLLLGADGKLDSEWDEANWVW